MRPHTLVTCCLLLWARCLCSISVNHSSICHQSVVKTCKVEHFQYLPGQIRQWREPEGLYLNSSYWSTEEDSNNVTFSFNTGVVSLEKRARLHSEDCHPRRQPLVFLERVWVSPYHFLADQLTLYAWALRDHGLEMETTQLVALNAWTYQQNDWTRRQFHTIEGTWYTLSGTEPLDWEYRLDQPLCASVAIFAERIYGDWWTDLRPQEEVDRVRKDVTWFISWVLRKLNLNYQPRGSVPRVTVIDRSHSKYRRLENADKVIQLMSSRGWSVTIIRVEKLTFEEQVSLMTKTDVLFAPHGAGLVNIYFLPPWAVAVELNAYGFGVHNQMFYPGFCNLARTSERTLLRWHDQTERERPADFAGLEEWKDLDMYLTEADQLPLFENVTKLLLTPVAERDFNMCQDFNRPAPAEDKTKS